MEGDSTMESSQPFVEKEYKAKNLHAERRRRSKLKERIYALRTLVPKITKMSKESTIDDAINYIEELQNQVDKLERELSELPEEDDEQQQLGYQGTAASIVHHLPPIHCQVEVWVSPASGNKLDVRIICENTATGFLTLLEALSRVGLEVTDTNVAVFRGVIMHIFTVEGREDIVAQKEHVREWLLQVIGARTMEEKCSPSNVYISQD